MWFNTLSPCLQCQHPTGLPVLALAAPSLIQYRANVRGTAAENGPNPWALHPQGRSRGSAKPAPALGASGEQTRQREKRQEGQPCGEQRRTSRGGMPSRVARRAGEAAADRRGPRRSRWPQLPGGREKRTPNQAQKFTCSRNGGQDCHQLWHWPISWATKCQNIRGNEDHRGCKSQQEQAAPQGPSVRTEEDTTTCFLSRPHTSTHSCLPTRPTFTHFLALGALAQLQDLASAGRRCHCSSLPGWTCSSRCLGDAASGAMTQMTP